MHPPQVLINGQTWPMEFSAAPPSLVKYEPALSVGDGDLASSSLGKTRTGAAKAVDPHLEEILNSVLPPRSV